MSALALLFDEYAGPTPDGAYWIEDDDTGEDYCRKHALEKIAKAGRGELCGGYCRENDSCCHCTVCGKLLDYTLTDHGADAELAHFKMVKFRRNKPLDRDTAYHLARLIAAKENDMDVIRIAARAIRSMRRVPAALLPNQGSKP